MTDYKVIIEEDNLRSIVQESDKYENVETGGLLFGKLIDDHIIITKIVNIASACRGLAHFEIDEEFAINETKRIEESGLEYIGLWHKHLGYGGPSPGDDKQAQAFLIQNTHKKFYLSLIIDTYGKNNHKFIATIYNCHKLKKFIKEETEVLPISSLNELDSILKDKKIDTTNFMNFLARHIEQCTGKKFSPSPASTLRPSVPGSNAKHIFSLDTQEKKRSKGTILPFISFPTSRLHLHDKISLGLFMNGYVCAGKVSSYKFSDLFFQKLDIIHEVKKMIEDDRYCSQLLTDSRLEAQENKNGLLNLLKARSKIQKTIVLVLSSLNRLLFAMFPFGGYNNGR